MPRDQAGFTLIEVLVAAFVASLVFGLLVAWMAQNLAAVGRAREQQRALMLGEQRARDFDLELRQSGLVEPGIENGEFPEPDADLGWEITVEPFQLALPASFDRDVAPSPLFAPTERQGEAGEPPLHRISVRVFKLDAPDADLIRPFVFFGVVPGQSPESAGAGPGGPPLTDENGNPLPPGTLRPGEGNQLGPGGIRPGNERELGLRGRLPGGRGPRGGRLPSRDDRFEGPRGVGR